MIFFGEEDAQNLLVAAFAQSVADKEEDKRGADTDNDLVQVEEFDLERHCGAIGYNSTCHSEDSAGAVGFFPEQAENQHPEEGCFKTAKGEHIDFPDNAGRSDGDDVNTQAQNNSSRHTEQTDGIVVDFLVAFGTFVHINIFDDG